MKKEIRGQVTIFIIVAIVIVALVVLLYMFFPQIKSAFGFEENPNSFMKNCMEDEIFEVVEKISLQGGSVNPEHYFEYGGEKIEYLCYAEQYYATCVVQQPMLKLHIETEIKNSILENSVKCLTDLKSSFEGKGYAVQIDKREMNIELLPQKVIVNFGASVVLTKATSERYNEIQVVLDNNLYELVGISNSIINWESNYGDAETTTYMNYYPDLKVEKKKQSDGTTIYILTDRDKENKFQFASRSVAWPPGYGTGDLVF